MSFAQTLKGGLYSFVGSARENIANSNVGKFFGNLSTSEPQQFMEAEQLGLFYVTKRVVGMGFPSFDTLLTGSALDPQKNVKKSPSKTNINKQNNSNNNNNNNNNGSNNNKNKNNIDDPTPKGNSMISKLTNFIQSESLGNKIARYLNKYHKERYMIWNLSEKSYDTSIFNDNVIEFKFPGYPAPPLEKLFTLLTSIDNWLNSNKKNVAIIHCQTGKGRTVTCISAYLAWSKYENYTPAKALLHVCKVMNGTIKNLTIPSQTRYLAYLTKILVNRQMPKSNPMTINKIIVKGIPIFETMETKYIDKPKKTTNNTDSNTNTDDSNGNNNKVSNKKAPEVNVPKPKLNKNVSAGSDDGIELGQNIVNLNDDDGEQNETKSNNKGNKNKNNNNNDNNNERKSNNDNIIGNNILKTNIIGSTLNNIFKPVKTAKPIERTVIKTGVRPYLQIFKNAKLIYSSRKKSKNIKFYEENDSIIKWEVNKEIEGDILIRIRHLDINTKQKVSVCRFAFHTGYLEKQGVIRFKKTQLDGAWNSERFPKDFWIDMLIGNANETETKQTKEQQKFWEEISRRSIKQSLKFTQLKPKFDVGGNDSSDIDDDSDDNNNSKLKAKQFDDMMNSSNNDESNNNSNNNKTIDTQDEIEIALAKDKMKNKKANPYLDESLLDNIQSDIKQINVLKDKSKLQPKPKPTNNNDNNNESKDNTENSDDIKTHKQKADSIDMDDLDALTSGLNLDEIEVDSETEQNLDALVNALDDVCS